MNKKPTLYTLVLISLVACRKDEKIVDQIANEPATVVECSQSAFTFIQPISNDTYSDILEDSGKNILLLGNNIVEKYNSEGKLLWSKKVGLLGKPQNIIQADGDNYFISSANFQVSEYTREELLAPDESKVGASLSLASYARHFGYSDCSPYYNFVFKGIGDAPDNYIFKKNLPLNTSTCQLTKVNKAGELLWSKTFAGNHIFGKTLTKTPDGNWLLLTAQYTGFYQTADFDANGVFLDTIHQPQNNHSVTLYKINAKGDIIWERKILNMFAFTSVDTRNYDWKLGMSVSNQTICVNGRHDYIIMDLKGNILKKIGPNKGSCRTADPSVAYGNNHFYTIVVKNIWERYLQQNSNNGDVITETKIPDEISRGSIDIATGGFLITSSNGIGKCDANGNFLWRKSIDSPNFIQVAIPNCNGGVIYLQKMVNGLNLIKTDENGNN